MKDYAYPGFSTPYAAPSARGMEGTVGELAGGHLAAALDLPVLAPRSVGSPEDP